MDIKQARELFAFIACEAGADKIVVDVEHCTFHDARGREMSTWSHDDVDAWRRMYPALNAFLLAYQLPATVRADGSVDALPRPDADPVRVVIDITPNDITRSALNAQGQVLASATMRRRPDAPGTWTSTEKEAVIRQGFAVVDPSGELYDAAVEDEDPLRIARLLTDWL